jgi:hypothetical protein
MSNPNKISWIRVLTVAIPIALALFGFFYFFEAPQIADQRMRLFQGSESSITLISIFPSGNFPLVKNTLIITNTETITKIMTAIRSAKAYFPDHPAIKWNCDLEISNSTGKSYISVVEALGQGTILYCETSPNGGLFFDTLQSTNLGQILEQVTTDNK